MILRLQFLAIACSFLVGCAAKVDPEGTEVSGDGAAVVEKEPRPLKREEMVGRVSSVDEEARFVLIELFINRRHVAKGALLRSYGIDGSSARLKFSGESMGSFAVADVLSGRLGKGDAVRFLVDAPSPLRPGMIRLEGSRQKESEESGGAEKDQGDDEIQAS